MRIHKTLILSFLLMAGCNDGGGVSAFSGEYSGAWDVRYNLTDDSCVIVEPGVTGFVDLQVIEQDQANVVLQSSVGFGQPFSGNLDENNNLTATGTVSGDIFGDGIPCQADQTISYTPTSDDRADTLFKRSIICADGYFCESRAIGEAIRR